MKFSVGQFPVHVTTTGEIAIVIATETGPDASLVIVRVPTMGQHGITHNELTLGESELYTHEEFLESELSQARERMQMNKKYAEIARQEDAPADTPATIPTVN